MPTSEEPKILAGQIWKECDPRFERFVRIEGVRSEYREIAIRTVIERELTNGSKHWVEAPRSRVSYCDKARFNGKRGGYALWKDV